LHNCPQSVCQCVFDSVEGSISYRLLELKTDSDVEVMTKSRRANLGDILEHRVRSKRRRHI
jgi:hypothetical protein